MRSDGIVRVLIVDDSPLFCRMLGQELERNPRIKVAAKAYDAKATREQVLRHRPDVITLDLELPDVDGLHILRELRAHYPVPVIICSGTTSRGGPKALRAIELGALDVVIKPGPETPNALHTLGEELSAKILMAAAEARPAPPRECVGPGSLSFAGLFAGRYLVAIGASTGGTEAIRALLAAAPADHPAVIIVQHMPANFTASFAERLNRFSAMEVTEARDGDALVPGRAVVARGDTHLTVKRCPDGWKARYTHQELVNRHCPSVNVLFQSVAETVGRQAIGVLLTGMGDDGALGLLEMRERGGLTIAQDPASCVVYGMPKAAAQMGAVMHQMPPEKVPMAVYRALRKRTPTPVTTPPQ